MNSKNKAQIVLCVAGTTGLLLVLGVLAFYVVTFSTGVSGSQEVWGQFGDYFGGLLNPILSFFAFVGLLFTVNVQLKAGVDNEARHEEQMFDSRMFQLLSFIHVAVSSLKIIQPRGSMGSLEYESHRAVAFAWNRLDQEFLVDVRMGDYPDRMDGLLQEFD